MAIYEYIAIGDDGKKKTGIIEADSQKTARQKLKKQNLMVTGIREKKAGAQKSALSKITSRVSSKEVAMVTRQLASLIKANVPLVEALSAMVEQIEQEKLKVVLNQVRQDINEGSSLAKAMAKHPEIFDPIFFNMIEAGESSGTLGTVLLRLADLKEAQMRLRSKVISGMTYPCLMMIVALGVMIIIFTFVIPKITKVFATMKKELPIQTKVTMAISDFLVGYWFILIPGIIFGLIIFIRYIQTKNGKSWWDAFLLRAPVVGKVTQMIAVARFAKTMATLMSSGVPILQCLNITKNIVGNIPFENAIEVAKENISEGQSIADPLRRSGVFPPIVIHMISIGEKTGELPEMLENIAVSFEDQVNSGIERMVSLIEPGMIIFMGLVVALIVFSVFLPLLEMTNLG